MLTVTTTRLIEDLKDPANVAAWSAFDDRYRRVLFGFGRHLGLSADDAAELAQRTLAVFAGTLREGGYQRERGRLNWWLIGIARNTALEMRRNARRHRDRGDAALIGVAAEIPENEHLTRVWQHERDRVVLARAMSLLRDSTRTDDRTLKVFELFVLRTVPAAEVARECGVEVDTVYVIKNRLTRRLRELVRELSAAYDEDD